MRLSAALVAQESTLAAQESTPVPQESTLVAQESTLVAQEEGCPGGLQTIFSKHHGLKICIDRVECALFHGAIERAVGASKTCLISEEQFYKKIKKSKKAGGYFLRRHQP